MSKTNFDNKLISFNRKITSNKTKIIITKDYNFFLGRMCFTSNDRFQNTFVYQPALDTLELKNTKLLIMILLGNQWEYIIPN